MLGLDEALTGFKIGGRNVSNLRYADDTTLMAESEKELNSLLIKVKEESEKVGLKLSIQKTNIMASGPIASWQIVGETVKTVSDYCFLYFFVFFFFATTSLQMVTVAMKLKELLLLGRKVMTNLDIILKSRDITLPTKFRLIKAMVFSGSHVWMWQLDYKESWALQNWCFWTVVLEKTLESLLDGKELQLVHPKGNQSWIFIGRTDAEAETPILWPCDVKNWLIWKDPDSGKDWRREEKGTTEVEMVGWHHQLNGHEFE